MSLYHHKKSQLIVCLLIVLVCLGFIGGCIYGMMNDERNVRLYSRIIFGGIIAAVIGLVGIADYFGLFDYLIY